MMKIALLGYGKMGKAIEELAINRGHEIVVKIETFQETIDFNQADVAIDFSVPEAAFNNISQALLNNVPVISGTTGWLVRFDEIVDLCNQKNGGFIYASNFSLGVNLFFALNTYLAKLMENKGYEVSITETHHIQKLDAPSGTAISLSQQIFPYSEKKDWILSEESREKLLINALRIDNIPGIHEVKYESEIDSIEIKHSAKNRLGFVQGAVMAAEFLKGKKGIYTMQDVLGLK
jgi:4-hydroxy-tetrahydrodipicolinate reductase